MLHESSPVYIGGWIPSDVEVDYRLQVVCSPAKRRIIIADIVQEVVKYNYVVFRPRRGGGKGLIRLPPMDGLCLNRRIRHANHNILPNNFFRLVGPFLL